MKKLLLSAITMFVMCLAVTAVPAKKGVYKTLKLGNGQEIRAMLVGDEHGHYWKGGDGKAYALKGETYQVVDEKPIIEKARARRTKVNAQRVRRLSRSRGFAEPKDYFGKYRCVIILVNFADVTFQEANDNALYSRIVNEENFSEGYFVGSMADYFKAQSSGLFELDFDVVGPVTVSKEYSHYGVNDSIGNDLHAGEMVIEALNQVKDQVTDWHQYDWDGDGLVDQVYLIYAGKGEADGGAEDTIWPHAYELEGAKEDGDGTGAVEVDSALFVNSYACGSELDGLGRICGIGTMCHEFSHCLGYPDFYDIDYSGGLGMDSWDLMSSGSYNGDGYCPAGYTAYERWFAGWKEPIVLEANDTTITDMEPLQEGGDSYIIYNKGNRNEYFILENRQLVNWDAKLPGKGLLMIHVDYDMAAWAANGPNDDPEHQRMAWIPADGKYQRVLIDSVYYTTWSGKSRDPFPLDTVSAFNKNFKIDDEWVTNVVKLYNQNADGTYDVDWSVENITQNADGSISFNFVAAYQDPTGIKGIATRKEDDKWYDLQGRQLNGKPSGKGIYINNGKKLHLITR